jgi:Glycine rich protein
MKRMTRLVGMTIAAVLAGLPWVTGAPVIVLFPQDVGGTVTLTAAGGAELPLARLLLEAVPASSGGWIPEDISSIDQPAGPAPHAWTLTLDGGDPADPANLGRDYRFGVEAYLEDSPQRREYVRIRTDDAVNVTSGAPPPPIALALSGLRTVTATITVTNGSIDYLYLNSAALDSGDELRTVTQRFLPSGSNISSLVETAVAPGLSQVSVWGQVSLIDSAGRRTTRSLDGGFPDLSGGDLSLSWTFDATPASGIEGTVSLANSTSAVPSSGSVSVHGVTSAGDTISTHLPVAMDGTYGVRIPDGQYRTQLNVQFQAPQSQAQGPATLETVLPNLITVKDFPSVPITPLTVPLTIDGFYTLATVYRAQATLQRVIPEGAGYLPEGWATTQRYNGAMMVPAQDGTWRYHSLFADVRESSPLPMSSSLTKEILDPLVVDHTILAAGVPAVMSPRSLTLVRGAIYLDLAEAPGDSQRLLSDPIATLDRVELNPDSSQKSHTTVYSYRTLAPVDLAAVGLVAEPGVYTLNAHATVDGATLAFPSTSIVFGEPISTPVGMTTAAWTPAQDPGLQVSLDFGSSSIGGVSSVVKTTQGPPPPEGFSTLCSPNQDDEGACPPLFYDIQTTVPIVGPTEVCVRQAYDAITDFNGDGSTADEVAGVLGALALYHFRTTAGCDPRLPPGDGASCWERLDGTPLPSGKPFVVDCSTDLAACGCASSAACGITSSVTVIQSCGLTTSFSPFAVLKEPPAAFFNTGVGASGVIQTWQVRRSGVYRVTAVGARGGAGTSSPALAGGCGASIDGELSLAQGETLQILVGQKGLSSPNNGGGGGGSFVARSGVPLIVAGGGGGVRHASQLGGRDASLTNNGGSGSTSATYSSGFVAGGTLGRGGNRVSSYGAGGGGWSGSGVADGTNGEGGFAFLAAGANAGRGGRGLKCDGPPYADGGFGGGGAGNGCFGGGGGGGYSGGGGGRIGGGGGSWNSGANPHASIQCTADGHGKVQLTWLRP